MLINKFTTIKGQRVILVPYRKEHVPKYHNWMQSKELQLLTASEPLTLDQEYEMQVSWQQDCDKCTFIILHRETYESTGNEIDSMIGDTNLFFPNSEDRSCAEAEIMIAERWARRKKCGWDATLLMLLYGVLYLDVKEYQVKIAFGNIPSINMFQNIGFSELSRSEVFKEVTFSKMIDDDWIKWLSDNVGNFEIQNKEFET
ncbi:hypothetical protein ABEB36_001589 [Hypothenemus hampei]|uniref:N-acetyltransferase domain-containing protein n=1 Tax=Hypothenemus hampei TaxID=57062 RepID=A0ABD1FGW6_HYPHA